MAAAAPAASGGTGSAWPAASSRFAAACGALSQYVKAAETSGGSSGGSGGAGAPPTTADAMRAPQAPPRILKRKKREGGARGGRRGRRPPCLPFLDSPLAETERAQAARPNPPAVRPLPLMPGADVDGGQDPAEAPAQKMTIVYGGRVLVLDDVPADKAAALVRLATAAEPQRSSSAAADLPVARKASLQRFMEKRKSRAAARAEPYRRTSDGGDACAEDHLKLKL